MLPYYILIFLPMLIALIENRGIIRIGAAPNGRRKTELIVFFTIFMLLLMFRGADCGVDTAGYLSQFSRRSDMSWGDLFRYEDTERGYLVLNKLISLLGKNPQIFLMITGLLTALPLLYFYKREAELPFLTIALFLAVAPFPMYFSGIRQSLAMGLAFPAWYLARDKKFWKFILIVLLAMQFHQSAFIMFAIYPLYHVRVTTKWLYAVVPLMVVAYLFNDVIFNFLITFLWDDYGVAEDTGATTVLLLLILFAIYAYLLPDEKDLEPDVIGLRNILLLSILLQCFAPVHILAMRMNYYFLQFVPILIPKIANRSRPQYRKVANISVIVMTLFFVGYYFLKAHTGSDILQIYPYVLETDILQIYPYIPFWQQM